MVYNLAEPIYNTRMSIKLPPGRYFVGDPCYVFSREDWDNFACDAILDGKETMKDLPYFAAHTANGDGEFRGSNGFKFGVDAGLLGAIPEALITKQPSPEDGVFIDAPLGLSCSEDGGMFHFGFLSIDTNDQEEEDDFSTEDDDDDET